MHIQSGFKGFLLVQNNPQSTAFMLSLFNFSFFISCTIQGDSYIKSPSEEVDLERWRSIAVSLNPDLTPTAAGKSSESIQVIQIHSGKSSLSCICLLKGVKVQSVRINFQTNLANEVPRGRFSMVHQRWKLITQHNGKM